MRYIITQVAKESIEYMHPHFFQTYGIQRLGECETCEHHLSGVCWLKKSYPRLVDDDGFCNNYEERKAR